jgi:hypothetical protein
MPFVVLAIVLAALAWFVMARMRHAEPVPRDRLVRWAMTGVAAALALRVAVAAPLALRVALGLLAAGALAVWLRRRGHGGDGPDDGHDPPVDPDPDPGPGARAVPRPERLDPEAFDRVRAEWEHASRNPAPD